jgi:hypothetical protein
VTCGAGVLIGSACNQGGIDAVELQANLNWGLLTALPLAFRSQAQQHEEDKDRAVRCQEGARGDATLGIISARSLAPTWRMSFVATFNASVPFMSYIKVYNVKCGSGVLVGSAPE